MDDHDETKPLSTDMHRQDSGYASTFTHKSPPDASFVRQRSPTTQTTSSAGSKRGKKTRAGIRRGAKTTPVSRQPKTTQQGSRPIFVQRPVTVPLPSFTDSGNSSPCGREATTPTSYFQFPDLSPGPDSEAGAGMTVRTAAVDTTSYSTPPQTTHYWTSDRTRRLEYAAIDAASQGFRGWMLRYVVPDCFVPKASRRVTFDDDTGSVRRYRIELESEGSTEKDAAAPLHTTASSRRRRS